MLARHRHFTRNGTCIGHVDEVGHYFDSNGHYRGSVSSGGSFFDELGLYRGHIDSHGRVWDEHGKGRGYLDKLSADAGKAPGRIADEPESGRRRGAPIA